MTPQRHRRLLIWTLVLSTPAWAANVPEQALLALHLRHCAEMRHATALVPAPTMGPAAHSAHASHAQHAPVAKADDSCCPQEVTAVALQPLVPLNLCAGSACESVGQARDLPEPTSDATVTAKSVALPQSLSIVVANASPRALVFVGQVAPHPKPVFDLKTDMRI